MKAPAYKVPYRINKDQNGLSRCVRGCLGVIFKTKKKRVESKPCSMIIWFCKEDAEGKRLISFDQNTRLGTLIGEPPKPD